MTILHARSETQFTEHLRSVLAEANGVPHSVDIAVDYFYLSGFNQVADPLAGRRGAHTHGPNPTRPAAPKSPTATIPVKLNLREADISNARLDEANLAGADFTNADLRHARLTRADLSDAILWHADLSCVIDPEITRDDPDTT